MKACDWFFLETASTSKARLISFGMRNHKEFWSGLSICAVPVRLTYG